MIQFLVQIGLAKRVQSLNVEGLQSLRLKLIAAGDYQTMVATCFLNCPYQIGQDICNPCLENIAPLTRL